MHFSEIIRLQCRHLHYFIFWSFLEILLLNYLSKMRGYSQFSLWIPKALTKICFFRIVIDRTKILLY